VPYSAPEYRRQRASQSPRWSIDRQTPRFRTSAITASCHQTIANSRTAPSVALKEFLTYGPWGVYWNLMRRRVLALVVVLLVGGAPEALALCHLACAASMADAAAHGHHGHSPSHSPTPSTAKTFKADPHRCSHTDDLPTAVVSIVRIGAPPAVLTTIFKMAPPQQDAERISGALQKTPPGHSLLATPLRV
jgi:hypothetical protein